ncbi:UvrY/SirA/GacA family response regulator transcription factor [Denitrificimonas caeni]|uniref:UvrY/SirA/GacA family response regulator transcription factor n=1 Tax=Denitrificimonas caeni TaxID=521720 RepID=A0AAF0ALT8_9GAMM|nr:UvrY/SirA/GacA family response regulator transcription factor [Denitrificimonas caeni]WBE26277.1 UvrY/SirA/GacA family response regulator transcription factor [Denitrificimonas caeni]
MIKLLLVDDHDLVRTAIARMLSDISDLQVLGQASSGEQAYSMLADLEPHVVLMDIRMPGIGGLEATRKIKQRFPQVKVLALSAYADDPFPTRLLQAGASGYLTKGSCIEETVRAIRLVAAGKHYLSPDIAQQMALKSFDNNQHNCPFEQLSDREMQVSLMIANGQKIQSISDLLCVSPKTVNTYRYRIFDKLNIENDVELALLAVRHNLVENSNP